jgi:hypothetical protein
LYFARGLRRQDDDEWPRIETPHRFYDPVDQPPAEKRMKMLRRRRFHPRAETGRHHDRCKVVASH